MHTDPIADLITRVNNGLKNKSKKVQAPYSKIKDAVASLLGAEGFVEGCRTLKTGRHPQLEVLLKYTGSGESVIRGFRRVSKPSLRQYRSVDQLSPFRSGLGVRIISTSKGLLTDSQAREQNLGGEVVCEVW